MRHSPPARTPTHAPESASHHHHRHPSRHRPTTVPPPPPPPQPASPIPYRTLNVRDALTYLDQVKIRFQEQNQVYNHFLDVMKLFKSSSIDTPGVIDRVSNLFRGFPSLIQGFNTFLPPGFRIECTLARNNALLADIVTVLSPDGQTDKTNLFPRDGAPPVTLTNQSLPLGWILIKSAPEGPRSSDLHPSALHDSSGAHQPLPPQPPLPPSHHHHSSSRHHTPSLPIASNAVLPPLDLSVTNVDPLYRHTHEPPASSHSHQPNPAEPAISSNTAAPSSASTPSSPRAYRYRPLATSTVPPNSSSTSTNPHHPSCSSAVAIVPVTGLDPFVQASPSSTVETATMLLAPELVAEPTTITKVQPLPPPTSTLPISTNTPIAVAPSLPPSQQQQQANNNNNNNVVNNKPVEFNYAISYVNKIKHRFIDQPEIYKTFLEILQTYQRDGMPIDSVYAQVTMLFENATDLLDEFKQFLPDLNNNENTENAGTQSMGQVPKPSEHKSSQSATAMLIDDRLQKHPSPAPPKTLEGHDDFVRRRSSSQSPRSRVKSEPGIVGTMSKKSVADLKSYRAKTPNPLHSHPLGNPPTLNNRPASIVVDLPGQTSAAAALPRPFGLPKASGTAATSPSPPSPPTKRSYFQPSLTEPVDHPAGPPSPRKKRLVGLGSAPKAQTDSHQLDTVASKPVLGLKAATRKTQKPKFQQVPASEVTLPVTIEAKQVNVDAGVGERTLEMSMQLEGHHHPSLAGAETLSSTSSNYYWHAHNRLETHDVMGGRTLTNTRELMLFESIKKYLNDKEIWNEFLRVLELYNLSIIDFKTLIDRVSVYIGDEDILLNEFKGFIGYDVAKNGLVEDEVWEIPNLDIRCRDKVDSNIETKEYGPSYKKLPHEEIDLSCSGRDELCWSVLNDEYFGAAKFGTESGGGGGTTIGHRKSNYEEVLALTEGERAHFSYWLECISLTIGHFESLLVRIECMNQTEKTNLQLGDNLGSLKNDSSTSIYNRTLRKVYEGKYSHQIYPFLRDYPSNSIPIVLRRLKEIELNWKSAESQWNIIWREVERRNYYKAQDHLVLGFKSNEKGLVKGLSFLKEIHERKLLKKETLVLDVVLEKAEYEDVDTKNAPQEQTTTKKKSANKNVLDTQRRTHALYSVIPEPQKARVPGIRPSHQLELGFQDTDIFFDVLRIVAMALDRSALSHPERRRIDETVRTLIPAVWNIPRDELEKQIPMIYDDEVGSEPSSSGEDGGNLALPVPSSVAERDLLSKKAVESLTRNLMQLDEERKVSGDGLANTGELETPIMSSPPHSVQDRRGHHHGRRHHQYGEHQEQSAGFDGQQGFTMMRKWLRLEGEEDRDILAAEKSGGGGVLRSRNGRRYYNMFGTSTYVVLFRLLHTLYSRLLRLKTIAKDLGPTWRRINSTAFELGLSHPIIGLDDNPEPSKQLYPYCLDQLSRYFDGEVDFGGFEESIRVAFPYDGYLLSTVDKVSNAILKQFSQVHSEIRNKELLALLRREREEASEIAIVQLCYRHLASSIVEDNELYRAEWHPERRSLSIQLVNPEDPTFELSDQDDDRIKYYLESYLYEIPTETVDQTRVRRPYRSSNLCTETKETLYKLEGSIELKKMYESLRLSFGGEECLIGLSRLSKDNDDENRNGNLSKVKALESWIEKRWEKLREGSL